MFPIHRLSLAFYHPSIDGLVPRIHVDVDEVLAVIVDDDSSFDDAGDGIPRSGAVPKEGGHQISSGFLDFWISSGFLSGFLERMMSGVNPDDLFSLSLSLSLSFVLFLCFFIN